MFQRLNEPMSRAAPHTPRGPGPRQRILITGSRGLIGSATGVELRRLGHETVGIDIRGEGAEHGDTRNPARMRDALQGVDGVVHLAAVSRVIDGEREPERCQTTNVDALVSLLDQMVEQPHRPWLVFASSREVYGHTDGRPTGEDAPLKPVNIYGRTKVEGERRVMAARERGLHTQIVRFSNVYGSTVDHADRVIPAFARGAVTGQPLRVDGSDNTFDFNHLSDSVAGLVALIEQLVADPAIAHPPIHFVTGQATTLGQLAALAIELGGQGNAVVEAPSRVFDVAHFCGDFRRAQRLLGWTPKVMLREGLGALVEAFREREAGRIAVAAR
ncbi:NAD-dependent epimerase/dehydratase family protein [Aquariibacter lacus]|uniref:NAD-dependent epimerase/dehydratase family protein n=1 Tax=Aquariibacter lacus TaxID=2801332 RepID=UPI003306BCAB